jgi:cytochrome oxidase Cu insertion factor (SCO1/SenC/PrrC family)
MEMMIIIIITIIKTQLGQALELLERLGGPKVFDRLTPLFISLDAKRDTPERVKKYVADFHPRLVGLTGTEEQIKHVTKAYRVYTSLIKSEGDQDDDYLIDHRHAPNSSHCMFGLLIKSRFTTVGAPV